MPRKKKVTRDECFIARDRLLEEGFSSYVHPIMRDYAVFLVVWDDYNNEEVEFRLHDDEIRQRQ